MKVNRVRVRVHGFHTDNKQDISSADFTITSNLTYNKCQSFFLNTYILVEGTTVFEMFRDSEYLDFIVLNVGLGISQSGYKENENGKIVNRSVNKGLNDEKRYTIIIF